MRLSLPLTAPTRSDLPIEDAAPGRLMTWLAGGIVAIAVAACGVALLASHHVARLTATPVLASVALPPANRDAAGAGALSDVLATLRATKGVAVANLVPAAELGGLAPAAPMAGTPRLVDLTFSPGANPDLAAIEAKLRRIIPGATVEGGATPVAGAVAEARLVRRLALALLGGLAVVLGLTTAALTRGAIEAQAGTVELLRLMGAPEARLEREVGRQMLACSLRGGLLGFALGTVLLAGLLAARSVLPEADLPGGRLGAADWAVLATIPIAAAALTAAVARLASRRSLQGLP